MVAYFLEFFEWQELVDTDLALLQRGCLHIPAQLENPNCPRPLSRFLPQGEFGPEPIVWADLDVISTARGRLMLWATPSSIEVETPIDRGPSTSIDPVTSDPPAEAFLGWRLMADQRAEMFKGKGGPGNPALHLVER